LISHDNAPHSAASIEHSCERFASMAPEHALAPDGNVLPGPLPGQLSPPGSV